MTALPDLPLPPELAVDDEPLTDDDLARYFDALDGAHGEGNFTVDSVQEYLRPTHPAAGWRIEDDGQAEWAFRKLTAANAEHQALALQAEDWASRIDHWFTQAARPLADRISYFTDQLEGYALRLRDANPDRKRVSVPSGVVRTTASQPAVEVDDEATVVAWLEADPARAEALKVVKGVLVSEVRKLVAIAETGDVVDADGQVVPGLAVRPGKTTAKVVPGG